jgi:hypothetical protein
MMQECAKEISAPAHLKIRSRPKQIQKANHSFVIMTTLRAIIYLWSSVHAVCLGLRIHPRIWSVSVSPSPSPPLSRSIPHRLPHSKQRLFQHRAPTFHISSQIPRSQSAAHQLHSPLSISKVIIGMTCSSEAVVVGLWGSTCACVVGCCGGGTWKLVLTYKFTV